jgi:hypothetical protein
MHKVREILRLKLEVGLGHHDVAVSAGVSVGVVSKVGLPLRFVLFDANAQLGGRDSSGAHRVEPLWRPKLSVRQWRLAGAAVKLTVR